MGQELDCRMQYQHRTSSGKAYLETDYILFRGEERLKIPIKDLESVTALDGRLHLQFPGGPAVLELGAAAEKWVHKILHPPTRADKLGIKLGLTVRLAGEFDSGFLDELKDVETVAGKVKADLIFLAAVGPRRTRPNPETRRHTQGCRWALGGIPQRCPGHPRNRSD